MMEELKTETLNEDTTGSAEDYIKRLDFAEDKFPC